MNMGSHCPKCGSRKVPHYNYMTGKDEYVCPVCDIDDGIYD